MPVCRTCPLTCNFCNELGFKSSRNRNSVDVQRSIKKAVSGGYKYCLLPCNAIFNFSFPEWINLILDKNLTPLIQLNLKSINSEIKEAIKEYSMKGCHFAILYADDEYAPDEKTLSFLDDDKIKYFFTTVLNKKIKLEKIVKALPSNKKEFALYLPLKKNSFDGNYSCYQLNKRIQEISKNLPLSAFRPFPGLDQFDPRISPDLELEPLAKPLLCNSISSPDKIKISVIIPAYNNQNYIQNNIRHLSFQNLPKEEFELIIVNDGSSDATGEKVRDILMTLPEMNYKYLYLPRPRKRFMGDAQFRAGIARNLGVKHSSGKYISFLDADMITPEDYLRNLLELLNDHDLIQTQRHYLKGKTSTNETNYSDLDTERDTFIPEKGYWHEFYNNPLDWNSIDAAWKYVCTYSLTLSRQIFCDIGWFRKTYMFYGFEDTDLGYRLFKQGMRFKLSPMRVYHLFQHNERSEYSNSDYKRQALLSKTAQIFYRNYLDKEIFFHLQSLINDGPGLEDMIARFR